MIVVMINFLFIMKDRMNYFKKHIGPFLTVCFLIFGFNYSTVDPADTHSDDHEATIYLSYSESEDSEDPSPGMKKLVFMKQVLVHSLTPAESFPGELKFFIRHQTFLLKEYTGLFEHLTVFFRDVTLSPHKSGIAIHAP
jgi:hypothetical protein